MLVVTKTAEVDIALVGNVLGKQVGVAVVDVGDAEQTVVGNYNYTVAAVVVVVDNVGCSSTSVVSSVENFVVYDLLAGHMGVLRRVVQQTVVDVCYTVADVVETVGGTDYIAGDGYYHISFFDHADLGIKLLVAYNSHCYY